MIARCISWATHCDSHRPSFHSLSLASRLVLIFPSFEMAIPKTEPDDDCFAISARRGRLKQWKQNLAVSVIKQGPVPQHIGLILDGNRRWGRQRFMHLRETYMQGWLRMIRVRLSHNSPRFSSIGDEQLLSQLIHRYG